MALTCDFWYTGLMQCLVKQFIPSYSWQDVHASMRAYPFFLLIIRYRLKKNPRVCVSPIYVITLGRAFLESFEGADRRCRRRGRGLIHTPSK